MDDDMSPKLSKNKNAKTKGIMKLINQLKKRFLNENPGLWVIYTLGFAIMALQLRSLLG